MYAQTIRIAVITLTIVGDGGKHLDRMLEQLEHYKTLANYDKHTVDVSYTDSIIQQKVACPV